MAALVIMIGNPTLNVGIKKPYKTNRPHPTIFITLSLTISFIKKDTATAILAA